MNAPLALTLTLTLAAASAHAQTPRAVFLLDRSGSMTLGGSPNRCESSAEACRNDILAFLTAFPNGEVSIREYSTIFPTGSQPIPGFPEWQSVATSGSLQDLVIDAHEAVDSSSNCIGGTPLADAICDGAQALLIRGISSPSAECFFYVYSDGDENASGGACSGGDAVNAATGRCSFDAFGTGDPFEADITGETSWQQNCCAQIEALSLTCDLVFNVYKFNAFSLGEQDDPFRFIDSAARGSGGFSIQVLDGTFPVPGGTRVFPTGCRDDAGRLPLLQAQGNPELGGQVDVLLRAGPYQEFLLIGQDALEGGINLGALGAPECQIAIDSLVTVPRGRVVLQIPQMIGLIGRNLEFQGVGLGGGEGTAPLLTSNRLSLTIVR